MWKVLQEEETIFIESEDFKHDVRLYVNGDFKSDEKCIIYAQAVADKLNNSC